MVDTVNIENVGGDAGIASELTLQRLLVTMELMANKTGKNSREAIRKANEQYLKSIDELDAATERNAEANRNNTDSTNNLRKAQTQFADVLVNLTAGALGSFGQGIVGLTNEFLQGGTELKDFTQHLPIVGQSLGIFASFIDNTISTFRQLSSVGAGFGNDLTEMRTAAVSAGLSLDEYGALISANAESLRLLGGTVAEGVRRFNGINKEMKELETGGFAELRRLGFTVEEMNEGMLSYVELQTRMGRQESRTNKQVAQGTGQYLKQLDLLAKVTGKSRKEMEATMLAQAQDAGFRAMANQLAGKELENFTSNMALIDTLPSDVASGLKDLADGIPQTEEGIALINTAGPQLMEAMERVAAGADPQILLNALGDAGQKIEGFAGLEGQDRAAFIQALRQTQPAIAAMLDAAPQITKMGNINVESATKEQAARDATSESLLTFEDTVRDIRATMQRALIDSGILDMVATGMSTLADTISAPEFKTAVEDLTEMFVAGVNTLRNFVSDWSGGEIAAALAAGIAGLFASKMIIGAGAGAIVGLFKKMLGFGGDGPGPGPDDGPGPGPRRGGGLGRGLATAGIGLGKGIAGIGKGIGAGIGAVLKGLASGIAAFANPGVAIGATVLTLAILGIGGAVAGATWMVGKSLPTFAEGMKSFETLDGAALSSAAAGMIDMSLAMAAFAAGSVVSGLGALASGITDGLASLIGGDSPLEKLEKFASYSIDAARVKNNAMAFVAYGEAMSSMQLGAGLGNLTSSISDGIVGLFDGNNPLDMLVEFEKYNFNVEKVKNNALAFIAYGEAMSSMGSGGNIASSSSVIGMISDGLTSLFGSDNPIEKIQKFGELDLNLSGIKRNAVALQLFGNAFEKMTGKTLPDADFVDTSIELLEDLADVDGRALTNTAIGIKALGEIKGLESTLGNLKGLDVKNVTNYTDALEELVETLGDLNTQLAGGKSGLFSDKPDFTAGDFLSQSGKTKGKNEVNNSALIRVLEEIRELNRRTLRAINEQSGNLY